MFEQRVILITQSRGDILHKKSLRVYYDAGISSRQQSGKIEIQLKIQK